ncbi:MAG TPA: tetratricopeptide repeat protein [Acetobacteraceae bacterium]|nr:tetratricopeptide repeat protein [Acetobacteraceae bacterium]
MNPSPPRRVSRTAAELRRLHALGMTEARNGRYAEALEAFRAAARVAPGQGGLHYLAGTALARLMRWDDAIAEYRIELAINPQHAGSMVAIGRVLARRGQITQAIDWLSRAVAVAPEDAAALRTLAGYLLAEQRHHEAIEALDRALRIDPASAAGWSARGVIDVQLGQVEAALSCFRRALELDPHNTETRAREQLLYALQHRAGVTRQELLVEHRRWAQQLARGTVRDRLDFVRSTDPTRRPRLGIPSRELSGSAAATLTLPAFEALAEAGYEIVCFSLSERRDAVTERFRHLASAWHDMADADEDAVLAAIEREQVDILFDLSGPTRYGCLSLFARRAAPVQISWAGYVGTTGVAAMDALIADEIEVPPGEEADYGERIVRLPDCYVCFDPGEAPPVGPLPALASGQVTFGCCNRAPKLNAPLARLWAEIMQRLPGSRLLLAREQFGPGAVQQQLRALLGEAGVPPERVTFIGTRSHAELLAGHGQIDIALDTHPYSGGVMTLESLWMGVPVLTRPGETFAGRHSATHLHAVGLDEWICANEADYVATALAWSGDPGRLAALRATLRERVRASPLCDGARFAGHLGRELDRLWQDWCAERGDAE